jgi:hypothetical protein
MASHLKTTALQTAAGTFDRSVPHRIKQIMAHYKTGRVQAPAAYACLQDIAQYLTQQFDLFADLVDVKADLGALHLMSGINLLLESISSVETYDLDQLCGIIEEGDEATRLGRMLVCSSQSAAPQQPEQAQSPAVTATAV